jgi:hypothetical protein
MRNFIYGVIVALGFVASYINMSYSSHCFLGMRQEAAGMVVDKMYCFDKPLSEKLTRHVKSGGRIEVFLK